MPNPAIYQGYTALKKTFRYIVTAHLWPWGGRTDGTPKEPGDRQQIQKEEVKSDGIGPAGQIQQCAETDRQEIKTQGDKANSKRSYGEL